MFCAALLFFGLVALFRLDGKAFNIRNGRLFLEMIVTAIPLPLGIYFGLYFYSGRKLATQLGGAVAIVLILGFIAAASGVHS